VAVATGTGAAVPIGPVAVTRIVAGFGCCCNSVTITPEEEVEAPIVVGGGGCSPGIRFTPAPFFVGGATFGRGRGAPQPSHNHNSGPLIVRQVLHFQSFSGFTGTAAPVFLDFESDASVCVGLPKSITALS
jgi:hypothetical protein